MTLWTRKKSEGCLFYLYFTYFKHKKDSIRLTLYYPVVHCAALYCPELYSTALYPTVLHCTTIYLTLLSYATLYCTELPWTILHSTVPYWAALHCPKLYTTLLCRTLLHCTALTALDFRVYTTALHSTATLYCPALLSTTLLCTASASHPFIYSLADAIKTTQLVTFRIAYVCYVCTLRNTWWVSAIDLQIWAEWNTTAWSE